MQSIVSRFVRAGTVAARRSNNVRVALSRRYTTNDKAPYVLEPLPYPKNALGPWLTEETLDFHYGKHHQTYVTKLNSLVEGTELATKSLVDLIKTQKGPVFNNAAQVWNHTFYWNSMTPKGANAPTGKILEAIEKSFGSFKAFQDKFNAEATAHFGSGWCWLVRAPDSNQLEIVSTHDAGNPMTSGKVPVLTCDVWEHAYYIDYRNARPKYMESWWNLVNWKFAESNLKK